MVRDGIYYAVALVSAGVLVALVAGPVYALPLYLLAAFCLYFFRDPEREVPAGPVAVSPADGKIVAIRAEGPGLTRISIFLNIFDVHVNRSPIAGTIADGPTTARAGSWSASREEASAQNEQNSVTVEGDGTQGRIQADRRADRAPHRVRQEAGRRGGGRRARGAHQVRLARGRISGPRVGVAGPARAKR